MCALLRFPMLVQQAPPLFGNLMCAHVGTIRVWSSRQLKAGGNAPEHADGDDRRVDRDGAEGGDKMPALDECGTGNFTLQPLSEQLSLVGGATWHFVGEDARSFTALCVAAAGGTCLHYIRHRDATQ